MERERERAGEDIVNFGTYRTRPKIRADRIPQNVGFGGRRSLARDVAIVLAFGEEGVYRRLADAGYKG